ncbi:hypothetical protein EW093_06835 [Thiospirochaeta perfilievii]|uniref:DUF3187 family protein n=1 Tax=Thiospirochaeta perfilievii TaxID=252967 RepID=A0A5C1Q8K6_9SPIO|nr:hypothetical protein [Thiospirochaeta perfilievii]QEN04423.1 hypothetical protein EW093_06835 [Thiospirochaeta perfilievii]
MNKILLTLLLSLVVVVFGETSFVSGFLNDNYTGSMENGVNGRYIGADDFLTFSLFAKSKKDKLQISEYYQVVTSRKFNYRYDLVDTIVSYDFMVNDYIFSPSISIIYKANLGGELIQNEIHDYRGLPALYESYVKEEAASSIGFNLYYNIESVAFENDTLRGLWDMEVPTGIKPISGSLSLEYLLDFKYFQIDITGGYKQYFNMVDQYSDFIRSGFIFGGQGVIKLIKDFTINMGLFFFPARNLSNDPYYFSREHIYSPQFWVSIGINGNHYGVSDIVNY